MGLFEDISDIRIGAAGDTFQEYGRPSTGTGSLESDCHIFFLINVIDAPNFSMYKVMLLYFAFEY